MNDNSIILCLVIVLATNMTSEMERLLLRAEAYARANKNLQDRVQQLSEVVTKQGQEILTVRDLVQKVAEENERLRKENEKLQKENEKLRAELHKHRNENTPSGALPPYLKDELAQIVKKAEEEPPETKSANANRRNKRPKPERIETHALGECPKCHHKLRKLKKCRERIVIHLSLPKVETLLHKSGTYFCDHCEKEVTAPVPDTTPNSKYDLNICLLVFLLNAIGTTQGKTKEVLGWFGVSMCSATVNNIICSMQEMLGERKYRELERDIKKTMFGGYDETTHRHHGKSVYIQAVATARTVFFKIFKSRRYSCAKKLPATKRGGNCDGTRTYDSILKAIQRCWAHLTRRIKFPGRMFDEQWEIDQFVAFSERIGKLFHEAKHEKRRGVTARKEYDAKLKEIVLSQYKEEANLREVLNYILSYEGEWFTFLRYEGMKPTNNDVERALRPLVIRRKVSQHTWSDAGCKGLAVTQSLRETCRLRGENFSDLVRHEIERGLFEIGKS